MGKHSSWPEEKGLDKWASWHDRPLSLSIYIYIYEAHIYEHQQL